MSIWVAMSPRAPLDVSYLHSQDRGQFFDSEGEPATGNNSFLMGNDTPLDLSLISSIDTSSVADGLDQSFASYTKESESPISGEQQMDYSHYHSTLPMHSPNHQAISPVSPDCPSFPPPPPPDQSPKRMPRPKSHHNLYYGNTEAGVSSQAPFESSGPKEQASKSMHNLLDVKNPDFSKSSSSVGSESMRRAKSEKRKSILNVFGLFGSSEKVMPAATENGKQSASVNNMSRISLVSAKSEKATKGDKPPRKLQKKSGRPVSSYAGAAPFDIGMVPPVPAALKKRLTEREDPDASTTIGVPYELTQRSKTPMIQDVGGIHNPKRPPTHPARPQTSRRCVQHRKAPREAILARAAGGQASQVLPQPRRRGRGPPLGRNHRRGPVPQRLLRLDPRRDQQQRSPGGLALRPGHDAGAHPDTARRPAPGRTTRRPMERVPGRGTTGPRRGRDSAAAR